MQKVLFPIPLVDLVVLELPQAVLEAIFSFLNPKALAIVSAVCSNWRSVATSEDVWRRCFMQTWGHIVHQKRLQTVRWRLGRTNSEDYRQHCCKNHNLESSSNTTSNMGRLYRQMLER